MVKHLFAFAGGQEGVVPSVLATSGCFLELHQGHQEMLAGFRELFHFLRILKPDLQAYISVNSDEYVRRTKPHHKSFLSCHERCEKIRRFVGEPFRVIESNEKGHIDAISKYVGAAKIIWYTSSEYEELTFGEHHSCSEHVVANVFQRINKRLDRSSSSQLKGELW